MQDIIISELPVDYNGCYYLGKCFNCSIFVRAAAGDFTIPCFDPAKMRDYALEFCGVL